MAKTTRQERSEKRRIIAASKFDVYSALAEGSSRARKMSAAEPFRAVPTPLKSFNRASTIGGVPLSCVGLITGPSKGGKTTLTAAFIVAFQRAGGIVGFIDVEQSGDTKGWLSSLGIDIEACLYVGRSAAKEDLPPFTYEETRIEVRRLRERFKELRRSGKIPWGTPMIIIVDSVSRMTPSSFLKRVESDDKNGRAGVGREQANMNAEWMLELGADIGSDDIFIGLIAHEIETQQTTTPGRAAWTTHKPRGGDALIYDSMMGLRVTFAGIVTDLSSDDAPSVGKRHRVTITKSKFGSEFQSSVFYTASGEGLAPRGFDRARELVHEALSLGVLEGPNPKLKTFALTLGTRLRFGPKSPVFSLKKAIADLAVQEEIAAALDARPVAGVILGDNGDPGEGTDV